jgi:hypothetical protein
MRPPTECKEFQDLSNLVKSFNELLETRIEDDRPALECTVQ